MKKGRGRPFLDYGYLCGQCHLDDSNFGGDTNRDEKAYTTARVTLPILSPRVEIVIPQNCPPSEKAVNPL